MHVDEAIRHRSSIRAFLEKPIKEELVREILDVARFAPSGGNLQPWKVIAVSGEAKERVIELAGNTLMANPRPQEGLDYPSYPPNLWEPYRSRRFKVGEDMYRLLNIPREDKAARLSRFAQNFSFFGAPVGLFFVLDRNLGHAQWAHVGMFMQTVALAATARGLSTCMQESWGAIRQTLHRHFGLPDDELLYCGMALGHGDPEADVNALRSDRAEVNEFARFEGF